MCPQLSEQDRRYSKAQAVLQELKTQLEPSSFTPELEQAVDQLQFALNTYERQKKADLSNRIHPIETTLTGWEKRLQDNNDWDENAGTALFVIQDEKAAFQKMQITAIESFAPEKAEEFSRRLSVLLEKNKNWKEKKRRRQERPRPFPSPKMKSSRLEKEMLTLLKDREISPEALSITDKDWWVQPGEFRYLNTAVLFEDGKGPFWFSVSFRQIKTLTGYGPTEIWSLSETRIRLP